MPHKGAIRVQYLFLLEQTSSSVGYDETLGLVVQARTSREARKLAAEHARDEGPSTWLSTSGSTCRTVGQARVSKAKPFLILESYSGG